MTARHAALSIGAVLVLGLGVYLFIAVRAQPVGPAVAEPSHAVAARTAAAPLADPPPPARAVAARTAPAAPVAPAPAPITPPPAIAGDAPLSPDALTGPKLDAVMAEANKAYDRGDLEEARLIASRLLAQLPGNVRMLRIVVSAACMEGDVAAAQASYAKLPAPDQLQMRTRCARYGVTLSDRP